MWNIGSRGIRSGLVVIAGIVTIPALLSALDRSAAYADAQPLVGGQRRSIEGLRREAANSLAAGRYAGAAGDARAVLEHHPLDRTALRILSRAEEKRGNVDLADDLKLAASFVSWRDPSAETRMFLLAVATDQLDDAARRADAISRLDGTRAAGFEALDMLLSRPGGARAVAARLATRPPWRDGYFRDVRQGLAAASPQAPALLDALAKTSAPATSEEADRVLAAMVAHGRGELAWAYWTGRDRRPAGVLIDDPDLRSARISQSDGVSSPFVWSMPADTPVRLIDHRDERGRPALRVEHRGDRAVQFVSRKVLVAAGRYRLAYQAGGSPDVLDRLHPDLRCSTRAAVALTGAAGGSAGVADVTVPAGCGLLQVGFTLEPGGSATPTEVSIRRVSFVRAR